MNPAILGLATLAALWLTAYLALQLHNHGVDGYLDRRAERNVRRAARYRAAAKWWRLFRIEGPRLFREYHADELREALCGRQEEGR